MSENEIVTINDDDYELLNVLGKGAYGTVYLAQPIHDEYLVVIKNVVTPVSKKDQITYEVSLLKWLTATLGKHSPFNRLVDYEETVYGRKVEFKIVLEYVEGETLCLFMNKRRSSTDYLKVVENIFEQLLLTINILHSLNVVHRDLKCENIMVKSTSNGPGYQIIIIDFGFSCSINPSFMRKSASLEKMSKDCPKLMLGSYRFIAPELLEVGHSPLTF